MAKDNNKARALTALLDSATLTEAANKAQISRKTLYNYIRYDLEFAQAYKAMQEQIAIERLEAMEADRQRAKNVIFAIMEDAAQPGAVRIKAAQSVLDAASALQERTDSIATRNISANSDVLNIFGNAH